MTGGMFSGSIFFLLALGTGIPSSTGQSKDFFLPGELAYDGVWSFCFWYDEPGENGTDDLGVFDVKNAGATDLGLGEADVLKGDLETTLPIWW